MKNINLLIIGGVRPQFIKMASLKYEIEKFNISSEETFFSARFLNTGQHYDDVLAKNIISDIGLTFDHELSHSNSDETRIIGNIFVELYEYMIALKESVDWVVVTGDATSSMIGAIVATRLRIPFVHIEAGVRSSDLKSLEEQHRRVISHLATVHFCTAKHCVSNLRREGITENVYWAGDIAHCFFKHNVEKATLNPGYQPGFILMTIHKSSNFEHKSIIINLISVLNSYKKHVLFIAHPKTKRLIKKNGNKHLRKYSNN